MDDIADLAININRDGVLVLYSGLVTQDVIETLGAKIRHEITEISGESRNAHKLFTVFVELAQNVIHHGVETFRCSQGGETPGHYATLSLGREGKCFSVSSASVVRASDQEMLEKRLQEINASTPEEIEAKYKAQRNLGRTEEGDRAGVGLFWVAKRTSGPFEYSVRQFADGLALFMIKVTI